MQEKAVGGRAAERPAEDDMVSVQFPTAGPSQEGGLLLPGPAASLKGLTSEHLSRLGGAKAPRSSQKSSHVMVTVCAHTTLAHQRGVPGQEKTSGKKDPLQGWSMSETSPGFFTCIAALEAAARQESLDRWLTDRVSPPQLALLFVWSVLYTEDYLATPLAMAHEMSIGHTYLFPQF